MEGVKNFLIGLLFLIFLGLVGSFFFGSSSNESPVYKMGWNCGVDTTKGVDNGWCWDKGTPENRTSLSWVTGYSDESAWVTAHTDSDGNLDQTPNYK